MAKYIGKRIVPKHCGYWDKTKAYEMECIVYNRADGNSYISRRAVPADTDISQTEYWALCSDFSEQMDLLEKHFTATEQRIKADNDATEAAIKADNDATEAAIRQDNTATKQHVDEAVARSLADMEEAVSDVDATNAALNARMDGIAGQATTDTEILDARTDAEGTTHANLGDHIRQADKDIQNILDYGEALVSISDKARMNSLLETIDAEANGTDGTVMCRMSSYGPADKAGIVVNGVVGESYGFNTVRFSKPIAFEAGKPYTVFIDDPQRSASANIYFYAANGGAVLKENGVNRAFSLMTSRLSVFVPDSSGSYVAGLYCHGYTYDNYGFHIYVLEGVYTEDDFPTFPKYLELRSETAALASVTDYARSNNLVRMRNITGTDGNGNVLITAKIVGPIDPGATVLNGALSSALTVLRISEELDLEEGETYTLYVDDGNTGKNYNVVLANASGSGMRENDAVLYFNLLENPYYQFVVPDDQKYHLRVHTNYPVSFENQPLRVYVLKGAVPLEQIRSFMGFEEGSRKANAASSYAATKVQIRDDIRKESLLTMLSRGSYDTNGNLIIRGTADKDADKTMVVLNGSIGDAIMRTTFPISDYASFETGQEYTVYALDQKQTIDYAIYFYKRGGGAMQQDGVNLGRSVINYPLWYITPDEGGEFRAGIYCHDGEFVDHPLRLIVLKGHYTLKEIREGITLAEYVDTISGMTLVTPEVLKANLIISRTNNAWSLDGVKLFSCVPMNPLDNAGMTLNGTLGPAVEKNNVILSEAIALEAGEQYTFYMDSDKSLDYQMWFGRVADSTTITMNGQAVNFNAASAPYGVFVPDTGDSVYLRIRVPRDMVFDSHKIHVYLVKGNKPLKDIATGVTMTALDEMAGALRDELTAEISLTASDADCFTAHSIKSQAVSDGIREENLVKMVSSERTTSDGEVVLSCDAFGRYDQAGCIVNGSLNASEGHSVVYMSEFFDLEAGESYTVFFESSDQSAAYAMYFYTQSGSALQQDGTNRGFSVRNEPFGILIPDTSGSYRVGIYASNTVIDHHEIHVYPRWQGLRTGCGGRIS